MRLPEATYRRMDAVAGSYSCSGVVEFSLFSNQVHHFQPLSIILWFIKKEKKNPPEKLIYVFTFSSRHPSLLTAQQFISDDYSADIFSSIILQPSKKGKRCIPQILVLENQTQCDFSSCQADFNEGNPKWRSHWVLLSKWYKTPSMLTSREHGHQRWP